MPDKTLNDADVRSIENALAKAHAQIEDIVKAVAGPGRASEILARRRLEDTNTGCCGNCGNSQCSCKALAEVAANPS
jgi:hypothetical protein